MAGSGGLAVLGFLGLVAATVLTGFFAFRFLSAALAGGSLTHVLAYLVVGVVLLFVFGILAVLMFVAAVAALKDQW